ncbi:MAG TPA: hypothetical protein VNF06_01430, partial [Candidatus Aquilonibacter sp.]|nr:hypothetical protein [Candidatus Aquilonibacter sp.]
LKDAVGHENLSVKLVSNPRGYNQIDKRWVEKYKEMWDLPQDIVTSLKLYTGEIKPTKSKLRDKRRMFFDEMTVAEQTRIISYFTKNKFLVISEILKGSGAFAANWMLVILKSNKNGKWILKTMNKAVNRFGDGAVEFTKRGSLKIGRITMQRKGGDAGRETAKMLQFKINPVELFEN